MSKSLYQVMVDRLESHGMFNEQAVKVMQEAMADESLATMAGRWSDAADGYPEGITMLSWLAVRNIAYKWIVKNIPMAWFRVAFAPGADRAENPDQFVAQYWKNVAGEGDSPLYGSDVESDKNG